MTELIVANLLYRPARTLGTILGIAIGVVLIVVTSGLARGMLRSSSERESRTGAELLFQSSGGFAIGASAAPLSLPVAYAGAIAAIDGVAATTPVGRYLRAGAGGLGFELIEGVAFGAGEGFASYSELTGLTLREGRYPEGDGELTIDPRRAADSGQSVGDTIELLGHPYRIVGITTPEIGARIKMPLGTLQRLLGNDRKCSWILVKTATPDIQEAVASRIDRRFPGNRVIYTRDIPGLFAQGLPSLRVFLDVVIGLATVVSAVVVLLAMVTAVTERTREIGLLKALGSSRRRVVTLVLGEAVVVGALGVVAGSALAAAVAWGITHRTALVVDLQPVWLVVAAAIALTSAGVGALYPALRAAGRDPVEALAHE